MKDLPVKDSNSKASFWHELKSKLKGPIMVLAPMANVTDAAFRRVIAKYGKPDVMWTEFVSADGLFMGGREVLKKDLIFSEAERPIVAQFFTSNPDMMEKAAALARELGFDGIDINMGCPDRTIEKQGAGAALMKNPKLARELIRAAKRGAKGCAQGRVPGKDGEVDLPVSVKTRIGYNKNELDTWLPEILAEEPAVVTVHARTRKEMSKVPARWEEVKRAVEIRDRIQKDLSVKTLIFGNGDALSLADAKIKAAETGADGVMLGRAIFGNPWLFDKTKAKKTNIDFNNSVLNKELKKDKEIIRTKLNVMIEHTELFEKLLGDIKNFAIMKKHFKAYVNGWEGAKDLRIQLMETKNSAEIKEIVKNYISKNL